MKKFLEKLGASTEELIHTVGSMSIMLAQSAVYAVTPPFKLRNIFAQMEFVGVKSLFVVCLTGAFTGAVLAMQSFDALKRLGSESLVGPTVALSMARELGPVLTGFMVAGRAGSAMATELGTMRVTEQIDALYVMGINPVRYLVMPRVLAGILMMPVLAIITDFIGVLGGYLVSVKMLGINPGVYIARTIEYVDVDDIYYGIIKATVFGLIITLVASYKGYHASGGASGVGKCATESVVGSCVLILLSDYVLTSIMF
jgi:phospholipid/cholesterol/gamma-HCH transport system permease protein